MEEIKKCTNCGQEKPLSMFYNDKRVKKDGKQAQCKDCINKQKQIYRSNHKKERNEYERNRRASDPEFRKLASERNSRYYKKMIEEGGERMLVYKERNKNGIDIIRKRNPSYLLFSSARWRAKQDGLKFDLDVEDIILPEVCPILGIKLKFNTGIASKDSYSLDRIVPSKGYVKGNVKVISKLANTMKQDATIEQLEAFSKNIINYMNNEEIVQTIDKNESVESEIKSSELTQNGEVSVIH